MDCCIADATMLIHASRRSMLRQQGPCMLRGHLQIGKLGFSRAQFDAQRLRARLRRRLLLPDRCKLLMDRLRTNCHGGSFLTAYGVRQQRSTCLSSLWAPSTLRRH